jgi:c-di-GMP-binding flagellar brake protein YcgR
MAASRNIMAIVKKDSSARRAFRVPVDLRGSVWHRAALRVAIQDLSLTGCLLQCPASLDAGTIVDVHVELGPDVFTTKARVVDASLDGAALPAAMQYLLGLEFLGLAARHEADLRRFLDEESRRRGRRALI